MHCSLLQRAPLRQHRRCLQPDTLGTPHNILNTRSEIPSRFILPFARNSGNSAPSFHTPFSVHAYIELGLIMREEPRCLTLEKRKKKKKQGLSDRSYCSVVVVRSSHGPKRAPAQASFGALFLFFLISTHREKSSSAEPEGPTSQNPPYPNRRQLGRCQRTTPPLPSRQREFIGRGFGTRNDGKSEQWRGLFLPSLMGFLPG